jgi:hypothetical protein
MDDLGAAASLLAGIPGLIHAFGRRSGPVGFETREATAARVGSLLAPQGRLLLLRQVHGAAVEEAPWSGRPTADAAVLAEPGFLLGIETADCLPGSRRSRRRAVAAVPPDGGTALGSLARGGRPRERSNADSSRS